MSVFIRLVSSCYLLNTGLFEKFRNVCNVKDYLADYSWKDNQNAWYSEYSNETFTEHLSGKRFELKMLNSSKIETIKSWINGITRLKKPKSVIEIISLNKLDGESYEMIIHRKGRNHGKVLKLRIKQKEKTIYLSEIVVVGVKTQYEISSNALNSDVGSVLLEYETIDNMWSVTKDEVILK
jgi:hypothetical protein